jgi:hypothetical protein
MGLFTHSIEEDGTDVKVNKYYRKFPIGLEPAGSG